MYMYIYIYIYIYRCPRRKFPEILQDEIIFSLIYVYIQGVPEGSSQRYCKMKLFFLSCVYIYMVFQKEVPRDIARWNYFFSNMCIYTGCPRRKFPEILQDEIVFSLICVYIQGVPEGRSQRYCKMKLFFSNVYIQGVPEGSSQRYWKKKLFFSLICVCTYIYKVSQKNCARLRENVPYVKVHRYNPK